MSKINHTAAIAALDTFADTTQTANENLVSAMRAAGVLTLEQAQPIVLEWVSGKEMFSKQKDKDGNRISLGKCSLVDGQRIAAGRKVLDSNSPAYDAAKKTYQRVMAAFEPAEKPVQRVEPKKEAKPLTKAEIAALRAAIAACGGNVARAVAGLKSLSA
jgi:hypothetical protein